MDAFQILDLSLNLSFVFWGALIVDVISLLFYFLGKKSKVWAIIAIISIILTIVSILGIYLSVVNVYSQLAK